MAGMPTEVTHPQRRLKRALRRVGLAALLVVACAGAYYLFAHHRPQPTLSTRELRAGVIYRVESNPDPPWVVHEIAIDLTRVAPRFIVTAPDSKGQLRAMTTSVFAAASGADVAINGDFFSPWWSNGPWDYYPHEGDPVSVHGFAASRGVIYAEGDASPATLHFDCRGRPHLERPASLCDAISGQWILRDGEEIGTRSTRTRHPRTAVCVDESRSRLGLYVVDGRQGSYSDGMRLEELAPWLHGRGCHDAINLDGGGSSTLVIDGEVKNAPVHTRLIGRERPVANHLGVAWPN